MDIPFIKWLGLSLLAGFPPGSMYSRKVKRPDLPEDEAWAKAKADAKRRRKAATLDRTWNGRRL